MRPKRDSIWQIDGQNIIIWNVQRKIIDAIMAGNHSTPQIYNYMINDGYDSTIYILTRTINRLIGKNVIHEHDGYKKLNPTLKLISVTPPISKAKQALVKHTETSLKSLQLLRVIQLLKDNPDGLTVNNIVGVTDLPRSDIYYILYKCVNGNKVIRFKSNGIIHDRRAYIYKYKLEADAPTPITLSTNTTTDRQPTETNERIWPDKSPAQSCFVCKKAFKEGDRVYIIKNNIFIGRHTTCARRITAKKSPTTEEEHLEAKRKDRQMVGGAKKQRTGGHGYTGGTGFKTID